MSDSISREISQMQPALPDGDPFVTDAKSGWRDFPYWLVAIVALLVGMTYLIATQDRYNIAYDKVVQGLRTTVEITLYAFAFACVLGLFAGIGRISRNVFARNISIFYIEFIRGVPILVLIFTIAYAIVPTVSDWMGFDNSTISNFWRGVIALTLIYGAFLAEVFRAGIESVSKGQSEAGRSLGMTSAQTMRRIVLPQAIRNMLPALGNDLIAMLKDSSLLSVLAVRELTQRARLYAGTSFDFRATYFVLTFVYLSLTLVLSLLLRWVSHRMGSTND